MGKSAKKSPLQDHPSMNRELLPGNSLPKDLEPKKPKSATLNTGGLVKYNSKVHRDIVSKVRKGLPIQKAAAIAGIHGSTAARWLQEGQEDPDGRLGKFALDIEKARAEVLEEILDEWREQATQTKQWTALATLAERLYSEDFGKKEPKTQVNVVIGMLEKNLHEAYVEGELVYEGS